MTSRIASFTGTAPSAPSAPTASRSPLAGARDRGAPASFADVLSHHARSDRLSDRSSSADVGQRRGIGVHRTAGTGRPGVSASDTQPPPVGLSAAGATTRGRSTGDAGSPAGRTRSGAPDSDAAAAATSSAPGEVATATASASVLPSGVGAGADGAAAGDGAEGAGAVELAGAAADAGTAPSGTAAPLVGTVGGEVVVSQREAAGGAQAGGSPTAVLPDAHLGEQPVTAPTNDGQNSAVGSAAAPSTPVQNAAAPSNNIQSSNIQSSDAEGAHAQSGDAGTRTSAGDAGRPASEAASAVATGAGTGASPTGAAGAVLGGPVAVGPSAAPAGQQPAHAAIAPLSPASGDLGANGAGSGPQPNAGDIPTPPSQGASPVSTQPPSLPQAVPVPVLTPSASIAQTAPTPVPTPAHPSLPEQIAPRIASVRALGDGVHRLTLRVQPEAIGAVRVVAEIRGDAVRLELFGGTEAAREALRAALPDLRRDLATSGLQAQLDLGMSGERQPGQRMSRSDLGQTDGGEQHRSRGDGSPQASDRAPDAVAARPGPGRLDVLA